MVFWGTAVAAAMVAVGLFYRVAATAMFVGLAYIFLLERARYLNHFYLIVLLAFLLIWLPLHRSFSVDARRNPRIRSATAPAWALWLLRFQIAVPYFFGGLAKLNADWLEGEPLRAWLAARTDFPLMGGLFVHEPVVWAMTYGALFLDLFVVAGLLYRPTRPWAFLAAVVSHLMNSRLFGIGVFPWLMIPATLVFFDPSWPRRIIADLTARTNPSRARLAGLYAGAAVGWLLGGFLPETFSPWRAGIAAMALAVFGWHAGALVAPYDDHVRRRPAGSHKRARAPVAPERSGPPVALSVAAATLLATWVAIQVVVPLRHMVIPGNVHWTEEGHEFAWHMKLRDKDADATFFVTAEGQTFEIDNDEFLTSRQESKMAARPYLMLQYVSHLEDVFEDLGFSQIEVRAEVWASLNGREPIRLVDPTVDVTTQSSAWFDHAEWILPLDQPVDASSTTE